MKTFELVRTAFFGALLLAGVAGSGCVADRPSRNGVFNENQYVRKDFLIQGTDANGQAAGTDPGWLVRAMVTETSTPNLLGSGSYNIVSGIGSEPQLVRFRVTQDKLQLIDQFQLSTPQAPDPQTGQPGPIDTTGTTQAVINAWPATNVDLKYRVNLDGEKTNFYEENQELDWQVRQWVKVQFDKNDFSDLAPLGQVTNDLLTKCADLSSASATLVDGSFNTEINDPSTIYDDYMEFTVQVAFPLHLDDSTCNASYAAVHATLNSGDVRSTETVNLKYSFVRAKPLNDPSVTYVPLVLDEKDPIHLKYGPLLDTVFNFDNATQLYSAVQYVARYDPTKPIVFYFDQNFPEYYKPVFLGTNGNPGIAQGTNAVLQAAGAAARVSFLNYNDQSTFGDGAGPAREFGDIRYNFLRWISDPDTEDQYSAVTNVVFDPRTGEKFGEVITFNDQLLKDVLYRIDAFLQTVGASGGLYNGKWAIGACTADQQIVPLQVINDRNATDTLFTKMQTYLNVNGPDPKNNHLGPADFTAYATEDADFMNAYFALIGYELFADPDANLFVRREGGQGVYGVPGGSDQIWSDLQGEAQWQTLTAQISNGQPPFGQIDGAQGTFTAASFANAMRDATTAHNALRYHSTLAHRNLMRDGANAFSLETVMEQDAQKCINGQWETQQAYTQRFIDSFWQQTFWHEFGHAMGLDHNFIGNVDQPNFTVKRDSTGKPLTDTSGHTLYNLYASSVMEYGAGPTRSAWTQGWGHYDEGAIAWIYANNAKQPDDPTKDAQILANKNRSQQLAGSAPGQEYPWKDPLGFCAQNDPDCTAGAERAYLFCNVNYERYSPICRESDLGTTPSQIVANDIDQYEWTYQWRNFRNYHKVWDESAYANAAAGFVVDTRRFLSQWAFDWSPGEIAATLYRIGVKPPANAPSAVDYYNQLTYKFLVEMSKANRMVSAFNEAVIQQSSGERPYATIYDKYYGDVTQQGIILDKYFAMQEFVGLWQSDNYDQNQAGSYISSWGNFDFDLSYQSVAETALDSMIGGQYAVYPYFIPTAVALFAQDTHNPSYLSNPGARVAAKDWIGGWTFPIDEQNLINFFRQVAVNACVTQGNQSACTAGCAATAGNCCASYETCTYDPTNPAQVQLNNQDKHFTGPDGLQYVYTWIPSRNEWVAARADRNIVTYNLIRTYNTDLYANQDDGSNGTYGLEYQIKYTLDAYQAYENPASGPTMGASGN
jgi:Met-zincin